MRASSLAVFLGSRWIAESGGSRLDLAVQAPRRLTRNVGQVLSQSHPRSVCPALAVGPPGISMVPLEARATRRPFVRTWKGDWP